MYLLFYKNIIKKIANKSQILVYIILYFISSINVLVTPYISKVTIDVLLNNRNNSLLVVSLVVFVFFAILVGLGSNYVATAISKDINIFLKKKLISKIYSFSWLEYSKCLSGDFHYKIFSDVGVLSENAIFWPIKLVHSVLLLIIILLVTIIYTPNLSYLFVCLVVFYILIYYYYKNPVEKLTVKSRNMSEEVYSLTHEYFRNFKTTKILGAEEFVDNKLIELFNKMLTFIRNKDIKILNINSMLSSIPSIWSIGVIFIGGELVSKGQLKISDLIGYMVLSNLIFPTINSVISLFSQYPRIKIAIIAVHNILKVNEEISEGHTTKRKFLYGDITIRTISFEFDGNYIYKDFDLDIHQNALYFIQGKNGIGKSTLLQIIGRFMPVKTGEILVNGTNINDICEKEYRKNVYYISSENGLFPITLLDNFTIGLDSATNVERIKELCRMLDLEESILRHPDGYSTICNNENIQFSQGELTKIFIIRGLLFKPHLWLLDEVLRSLDTKSKVKIIHLLRKEAENAIVLLISHDGEIVKNEPNIINLDILNK